MQGPGGQTSAPPATADVIAAQSQDYVDENLAAFQVKTSLILLFCFQCFQNPSLKLHLLSKQLCQ